MLTKLRIKVVFVVLVFLIVMFFSSCGGDNAAKGKAKELIHKAVKEKPLKELFRDTGLAVLEVAAFDKNKFEVASGKGTFIAENGWFVICAGILDRAEYITVQSEGGNLRATIKFINNYDKANNIALFKLEGHTHIPYVKKMGTDAGVGDKIYVIGSKYPKMGESKFIGTILSQSTGQEAENLGIIDVDIPSHMYGSPVINKKGEVLGVVVSSSEDNDERSSYAQVSVLKEFVSAGKFLINERQEIIHLDELNSVEGDIEKGNIYMDIGLYDKAANLFRAFIKKDPMNSKGYYKLGSALRLARNIEATDILKKALDIEPEFADGYFELGKTYLDFKMYTEAAKALNKAVSLKKWDYEIKEVLGKTYLLMKKYKMAVNILDSIIDYSSKVSTHINFALSHSKMGQYGRSIRILKNAMKLDGDLVRVQLQLADDYMQVKNWNAGLKLMSNVVVAVPENPYARYYFSSHLIGSKQKEAAERECEIVREILSKNRRLWSSEKCDEIQGLIYKLNHKFVSYRINKKE